MNTSTLVQKVWNFCHTLRDDDVGYGDYLEQLTPDISKPLNIYAFSGRN